MVNEKCGKCRGKIHSDEETVLAFEKEFHLRCCPHRVIKRRKTHGGKSRAKLDCVNCGRILNGQDMKEIKKRKAIELLKQKKKDGKTKQD